MRLRYTIYLTITILTIPILTAFGENHFALHIEGSLGEGIPVLTSTGFPIALYSEPDQASELIKYMSVPRGEELRVGDQDCAVIVRKAGVVKVVNPTSLQAESFGDVSILQMTASTSEKNFTLPAGFTFEYLTLTNKGGCFIKIFSEILFLTECGWVNTDSEGGSLSVEEHPSVERWVKINEGWVRIDGTKLPFDIRREMQGDEEKAHEKIKGDGEDDGIPEGDKEKKDDKGNVGDQEI